MKDFHFHCHWNFVGAHDLNESAYFIKYQAFPLNRKTYFDQKLDWFFLCFFFIWVFFHEHSWITGLQRKRGGGGGGISLTPHYHFHPLQRHLDISRAITAERSPRHIASSRTQTGNLWFLSASREPLSYAPYLDCYRWIWLFQKVISKITLLMRETLLRN